MKQPRRILSPALLELARRAGDGQVSPAFARAAKDKLQSALERPKPSLARTFAPLVAATAIAMAMIFLGYDALRVRFEVSGAGVVAPEGYVHAAASEHARITFSEGTLVDVDPGSTVRIDSAGLRGADLVQENGRATYSVVHRPATAWNVKAGPYRVLVTGTRFSLQWLPEPGEVVVELYEGTVTVEGPNVEGGVSLDAGKRLKATVGGNVVVDSLGTASGDPSATAVDPGATAVDPGATAVDPGATAVDPRATAVDPGATAVDPRATAVDPRATAVDAGATAEDPKATAEDPKATSGVSNSPSSSLADRLARGEASEIVADVERIGLSSFAATASAADLAIVADAARFARKTALANATLLALRQHHPRTREAALAAFHLGRSVDETNPTAALGWYDTYLAEAGAAGVFVPEARGRKMVAVQRTAGDAAARPLAEAYLAAYPKGPHARQARAILDSSPTVP